MGSKLSTDEIENKLKSIFPKYTFDLSNYTNTHCRVPLICDNGHKSEQIVKNLLKGHRCKKCSNILNGQSFSKKIEDVIEEFNKKHKSFYDYSEFTYKNNRTNSTILCPKHGPFLQSATTHLKGHGCPKCSKNKRLTNDEFIKNSNDIHSIKYDYSLVDYKNQHTKVKIICPKHGSFEQTPYVHKYSGCPKCNQSRGERLLEIYLNSKKIKYISQKKFNNCKYISNLIFDFYLPDYNTCIEFNGIQHYFPVDIFGGDKNLEITQKRDKIKIKYCKDNNINLIIIKQDKKHINIEDINNQINNIYNILTKNEMNYILKYNDYKKSI